MSEWRKVKLGEISKCIQTGPFGSQLHQSDYSDCGIPVVMPKDIINGHIDETTIAHVEQHHVDRLYRHKISKGDILYARRGDVGKCAFAVENQEGWLCGTGCLRVTINKELAYPKFVFFQLQKREIIGWVEKHAIGATMLNLNTSILSEVPIELPSLNTQKQVVDILSRYDTLIENYQKQIKLLEEAAQRLYKEWFVDLHFPGHEKTKIVDGVPEGWERKKLGDITCKFATGLNPRKNFVLGQGNNYYVTIKNMANNDVIFDEKCDKVNDEALEKINKRSDLQQGDLLFSGIGTIGRVYLIDKPVRNWNISESVFTMRPNPEIPSTFLYLVLLDKEIQDYCQSNAHGCAQKGIRMADLKAFDVLVPSSLVLDAFNIISSNIIAQVKFKSSQIRLLTEARDRLLPKLMSGEIAV